MTQYEDPEPRLSMNHYRFSRIPYCVASIADDTEQLIRRGEERGRGDRVTGEEEKLGHHSNSEDKKRFGRQEAVTVELRREARAKMSISVSLRCTPRNER